MGSQVCDRCASGLLDKEVNFPVRVFVAKNMRYWPHWDTVDELEISTKTCVCCRQLLPKAIKAMHEWKKGVDELTKMCLKVMDDDPQERYFCNNYEKNLPSGLFRIVVNIPDITSPYSHGPRALLEAPVWTADRSVTIDQRLQLVRSLHDICMNDHKKCSEHRLGSQLPTRLLELGKEATDPPRLIETGALNLPATAYMTLNHRWGSPDHQPLRTLKHNYEAHRHRIESAAIPKTFRDAMLITHKLGLRYLWIDSLCIIQDDALDWTQEAAKMSDVYSGSYLNIAASQSENAYEGCHIHDLEPPLKLIAPEHHKGEFSIRCSSMYLDTEKWSLLRRGWVFQEMELAPRILFCGKELYYWQCLEHTCSEDGVYSSRTSLRYTEKSNAALTDWSIIMRKYSQLDFTYGKDRLVALAGVVKLYQRQHKLAPFLGWWKEDIVDRLDWAKVSPYELTSRPDLPSWSWLSIDNTRADTWFWTCEDDMKAPFLQKRTFNLAFVTNAKLDWAGQPLVSELKSHRLVVRGFVMPAEFEWNALNHWYDVQWCEPSSPLSNRCVDGNAKFDAASSKPVVGHKLRRDCLILRLEVANNSTTVRFIVLEASEANLTGQLPVYQRIGHGRASFHIDTHKWERFQEATSDTQFLALAIGTDITSTSPDPLLRSLQVAFGQIATTIELH